MTKTLTAMGAVLALTAVPVPAQAQSNPQWRSCADTLEDWKEATGGDTRMECATVVVPLDYADPGGRKLNIAVGRLKATGASKGTLLVNPGGPGGGGIAYPLSIAASGMKDLATDHDIVGFDPRGVGFSDGQLCGYPQDVPQPPDASEFDRLKVIAATETEYNQRCAATDPAFVRASTTENTARDMDVIRAALGERKISFYGTSWGTAVGAIYRTLFDDHVDRMWLESVMPPTMDLTAMDESLTALREHWFDDFTVWLAPRDHEYHFGTTPEAVRTTLLALRARVDEHPREGADDWAFASVAGLAPSAWTYAATQLAKLNEGTAVTTPAAESRARFVGPEWRLNLLQNRAVFCNDATGPRDFASIWANRQDLFRAYPAVGGAFNNFSLQCPGWPVRPRPWHVGPGKSPLMLSAHLHETDTPYAWALDMQREIGGTLVTIPNGTHGSVKNLPCAAKIVEFIRTGRPVAC